MAVNPLTSLLATMDVSSFAEIEDEFAARVRHIVWCTMTTVDRRGRPRSRILHPIWEGPVLSAAEGPVLSAAEGPALSAAEGPVLSAAEGPVLSPAEGPALSAAEGPVLSAAEGPVCWAATGRRSFKGKHIARNAFVSLTYWDPQQQQIYADCRARWEDDPAEKRRVWELYNTTPPPLGYDLGRFFRQGPDDPNYGLLKLTPWRIELWSLPDMMSGIPNKVWRNPARAGDGLVGTDL